MNELNDLRCNEPYGDIKQIAHLESMPETEVAKLFWSLWIQKSELFMGKTDIWMPLYIGDYIRDTMQLSPEKHGVYLLLIMHYWEHHFLPDDIEELAIIARVGSSRDSLYYILKTYFIQNKEENRFVHARLDKELVRAMKNKESRIRKAKKGANARWNPTSSPGSNATGITEASTEQCPSPSSSPSSSSLKDHPTNAVPAPVEKSLHKTIEAMFLTKVGNFSDYGKEGKAIQGLIKKFERFSPEDPSSMAKQIISKYYDLRLSDKFFSTQPFTPSALNASGIFDRVMVHFENKENQMDPEIAALYEEKPA